MTHGDPVRQRVTKASERAPLSTQHPHARLIALGSPGTYWGYNSHPLGTQDQVPSSPNGLNASLADNTQIGLLGTESCPRGHAGPCSQAPVSSCSLGLDTFLQPRDQVPVKIPTRTNATDACADATCRGH